MNRSIHNKMYDSYCKQIDMVGGNYCTYKKARGGCNNCNAAFKLGSGFKDRNGEPKNAYGAPEPFFDLPMIRGGVGVGGRKRRPGRPRKVGRPKKAGVLMGARMRKPKMISSRINHAQIADLKNPNMAAVKRDFYSLIKELSPAGYKLGEITNLFHKSYKKMYGGAVAHNATSHILDELEKFGEHQYF
jgi:hypothetical protein